MMAIDLYDYYTALEPNHDVRVDDEGYQWVRCPFVDAETPWSPNAGPDEVDCAFCQVLRDGPETFPEPHAGDEDPPVAGGAHGKPHSVTEWAPCKVPNRAFTWAGLTRPIHEGIYGQMVEIRAEWERRGGQKAYQIRSWWGYAARNCTGASWHERAVAVDINPAENPMVAKRTPCPSDMPGWFVALFTSRGFGWGGAWKSKCDAMHFSKGPNEGGNGLLYESGTTPATPPPSEGDDDMLTINPIRLEPNETRFVPVTHHVEVVPGADFGDWSLRVAMGRGEPGAADTKWAVKTIDGSHGRHRRLLSPDYGIHMVSLRNTGSRALDVTVYALTPERWEALRRAGVEVIG